MLSQSEQGLEAGPTISLVSQEVTGLIESFSVRINGRFPNWSQEIGVCTCLASGVGRPKPVVEVPRAAVVGVFEHPLGKPYSLIPIPGFRPSVLFHGFSCPPLPCLVPCRPPSYLGPPLSLPKSHCPGAARVRPRVGRAWRCPVWPGSPLGAPEGPWGLGVWTSPSTAGGGYLGPELPPSWDPLKDGGRRVRGIQ